MLGKYGQSKQTMVLELGLSVALFELNRTIWQDFFCIFVIYFTKGNFFGNLLHPFELKYRKFITEPPYPYNMCGIDLYSMYLTYPYGF